VKLISLWEPWATLMAIGAKRIETRSWQTSYRGWLAIHASKGGLAKSQLRETLADLAFAKALECVELKPGHILAVVKLEDCCPMEDRGCLPGVFSDYPDLDTQQERAFGDYHPDRWAWVTDALFRLEPIPYKASQGLCDVLPEALEEIRRQWKARTK
jgi:hypothetical protein